MAAGDGKLFALGMLCVHVCMCASARQPPVVEPDILALLATKRAACQEDPPALGACMCVCICVHLLASSAPSHSPTQRTVSERLIYTYAEHAFER